MAVDRKNVPGTGTGEGPVSPQRETGPVCIDSYEALLAFAARVNGGETGLDGALTADIRAADRSWTPIGVDLEHAYAGVFDGRGHSITGLSNEDAEKPELAGLFGCIVNGTVRNVELRDASIRGSGSAGGVAGWNTVGSVENCAFSGSVTVDGEGEGSYAGGVIGENSGSVKNCAFSGSVRADGESSSAGGIVGWNTVGNVENCVSGGSVTADGKESRTGGVVGFRIGRVESCFYLKGTAAGGVHGADEPGAMPLAPEQLRDVRSFPGWDFENIWIMGPDGPVLRALSAGREADRAHIGGNEAEAEETDRESVVLARNAAVSADEPRRNSPEDPVRVDSYEALLAFAARVNGGETGLNGVLTADITAADRKWTPIGVDLDHRYVGVFDGQGHSIVGLSSEDAEEQTCAGLFGCVKGTVRNVVLRDASIRGSESAGGVVGDNEGSVENCTVDGTVTVGGEGEGSYAGGVIGENSGSVKNCAFGGSVRADGESGGAGGIVGWITVGSVENCVSGGSVRANGESSDAGGVAGWNFGSVENCAFGGSVTVGGEKSRAGGVVGWNYGSVENCTADGAVTADGERSNAGGVAGFSMGSVENCAVRSIVTGSGKKSKSGGVAGRNEGSVENCAVRSIVTGSGKESNSGGVAGWNKGSVENCAARSIVTCSGENSDAGGIAGYNQSGREMGIVSACFYLKGAAAGGVCGRDKRGSAMPLTWEQFRDVRRFPGWDFENVWVMGPDGPELRAARK